MLHSSYVYILSSCHHIQISIITVSFVLGYLATLIESEGIFIVANLLRLWRGLCTEVLTSIFGFSWVPRCTVDHDNIICYIFRARQILGVWFIRVILLLSDPAEPTDPKRLAFLIYFIFWLFSARFAEDRFQVTMLGSTIESFALEVLSTRAFY